MKDALNLSLIQQFLSLAQKKRIAIAEHYKERFEEFIQIKG
ncbi:MAG TPA: hypothetical protein PKN14_09220 [Bacteroidia bacterium]|nr:MAG: hypothetical protein UZ10_BCD003001485 [Bacteroidetes bacterium OLB10]HNR49412.1 hypothetical protein [Bacteroidia bacterium]HRV53229.1 hypothetical protein [Bacteroidia bacterium]